MFRSTHKLSVELASFYKSEIKAQEPGTCSTVAGCTWGSSWFHTAWLSQEAPSELHSVQVVASLRQKDRIQAPQELPFQPPIDGK